MENTLYKFERNPKVIRKITLATIKSFIAREQKNDNLYISNRSSFDGMVDCVMPSQNREFRKASIGTGQFKNDLGVRGAWFVGSSRDYFTAYADDSFIGYEVSNACGDFIIAMKRIA